MLRLKKELKKGGYKIKLHNLKNDNKNDIQDFFFIDKKNFFINELDKNIILFQSDFSKKDAIVEKLDNSTLKITFYQNKIVSSYYCDLITKKIFKIKLKGLESEKEKIYFNFTKTNDWKKAKIMYDSVNYETKIIY